MQTLTHAWLALMIDISIKSLALAVLAGSALAVLRIRDTNLRHRVWTAVLLGMLLMPALVHLTPAIPLPQWMTVAMAVDANEPIVIAEKSNGNAPAETSEFENVVYSNDAAHHPLTTSPTGAAPFGGQRTPQFSAAGTESQNGSFPVGNLPEKSAKNRPGIIDSLMLILATSYLLVVAVFAGRLMIGMIVTRRLIAEASEIRVRSLAALPRLRRVRLLETGRIQVPATVGFIRPIVFMPACWREWSESKLQAVLAHELAHVRRADWIVITLAELNRAIYWFHPLAWFLRRKLSELAERNCDDAVLQAEGDRAQYARHLLEVAGLLGGGARNHGPAPSVAMARKPNVETRIEAILDAGRPLARRLSAIGLATLVGCGAIAILVTAAISTSAEDKPKKSEAEVKMKGPERPQANPGTQAADRNQPAGDPKQQHVIGHVLDPDGKPIAGATVVVAWTMTGQARFTEKSDDKVVAKTRSDARGAFELNFSLESPEPKRVSRGWKIIALADGFGPAWQRDVQVVKNGLESSTVSLVLAQDLPVRGRIVDLEGTPLAGIQVRIHALYAAPSEQAIADWIQDAKKKPPPRTLEDYSSYAGGSMMSRPSRFAGPFPAGWNEGIIDDSSLALPREAMADGDGRVEFKQLGANRMAIVEIEGPSIAKTRFQVVVRNMETVLAEPRNNIGIRAGTYFGRDFQFVAEPAQPIVGAVKDAKTNEPLVNYQVDVERVAGNIFGQQDFLSTRTDEQGRYRINGAPRGGGHAIKVNPTPDQSYFPTEKTLKTVSGLEPITCDFALNRGRWITGKVTDHDTKAPIKGAMVDSLPLRSNPNAKDYPNYDPNIVGHAPSYRYFTADDGSFRVLAIPGKGILGGIAMKDDEHTYMSLNKESVPKEFVQADGYLTTYHPWTITGYHAIKEVEIPESSEIAKYDLEFTRGLSRVVKIIDAQGKPVVGVRVLGRVFPPRFEEPLSGSAIKIIGIRTNQKREVVFNHPERRIGKAIEIAAGDETTVELQPCAVARGRIVNEDRQPISGLRVKVDLDRPDNWSRELLSTTTGEDGRFEAILPPGTTYDVSVYIPNRISVLAECRSTPGAVFELGDLTNETKLKTDQTEKMVTRPAEKAKTEAANPNSDKPSGRGSTDMSRSIIYGQITGVDGKPAAGADVAVIASRKATGRGGDLAPLGVVLAERRTDSEGRYRIELTDVSSKTHRFANVIARMNGTALAWHKLSLDAGDVDESFELQPEETISGRLVDIEGQPGEGVHFHVSGIVGRIAGKERWPTEGVGLDGNFRPSRWPSAWPEPIVTDAEGRFAIHGVPRQHGVNLEVEGSDRFGPQQIVLNSGMAEQRGERDATYRSLVKNLKPGEEAVLPLSPAQLFAGTVRYEDTGEPAPFARLTVWSSQEKFGSSFGLPGKADEKGYYKISAHPGIRFGVIAYPPDGVPYLAREKNEIPWEDGARSKVLDMALPRGVLIQGKVLEEDSDSPIAGAAVQYHAEEANNSHHSDDIVTGWQDIHLTDKVGRFSIVVLPGPGRLLVHGPGDGYVLKETSERELYKGKPGGRRNYAHAIEKINPEMTVAPPEIVIRLKRGATVRGELVDQQGKAVDRAEVFSRLHIDPGSLWWRGFGVEATGGRFELLGLAQNREYPIYFLDSKRRLGATLIAKAGKSSPRIVLEPCGTAKMRFVDDKGKPVAKYEPFIQMVVTPGEQEHSEAMMKGDSLAADAESVSSIDPANHPFPDPTDDEGRFKTSALIPGATYRVAIFGKQRFVLAKEFKAVAGETLDLGDIVVERRD